MYSFCAKSAHFSGHFEFCHRTNLTAKKTAYWDSTSNFATENTRINCILIKKCKLGHPYFFDLGRFLQRF